MIRENLTNSMMTTLLGCMRKYYYRYELRLQHTSEKAALTFGSAWHRAMEARWQHKTGEEALMMAVADYQTLDELQVATLTGLLTGYYHYYPKDPIIEMQPEQQFEFPLQGSRTFNSAGKIDGIGTHEDGRSVMMEHKTTSDSVAPESDYWLRLRCNNQIMMYVDAARLCGLPAEVIYYDVTRKPTIRPKTISTLDEQGHKIVKDANGQRVMKKDNTPRESGDTAKGYVVQTRLETNEEYCQRLTDDTITRPEFYFARREVPVLDQDLNEFLVQRLEIGRMILSLRRASRSTAKPYQAWPRNSGAMNCNFCEFKEPCLQNIELNPAQPPAGFIVGERNPELAAKQGGTGNGH